MKLGIMQPYFFPYIGYFDLINRADKWIVFDIVKYKPLSWMNRNRIHHPSKGWQYIKVPVVNKSHDQKIMENQVQDLVAARARVLGQLIHYKKNAPYYQATSDLVSSSFEESESDALTDLNVSTIKATCSYLNIDFDY